jgi:Tfp pilus assembly protein PilN
MVKKANMCILFRDETVDVVFIDYTVLGAHLKFIERLPRDEQVYEAVADLMQAVEKTPSRVTLCVPRDNVMQRTLRYPAMVQNDIGNMIQFEATRHVPLSENDRALAWSVVPSPDEQQVILNLVAARETEISTLVSKFQAAGVPIDEALPFSSVVVPAVAVNPTLMVITDVRSIELCLYGEGQLQDSQLMGRDAPGFSPERVVTAARQMVAKHKDWLGDEGIGQVLLTGGSKLSESFEMNLGSAFGLHVHPLNLPEGLVTEEPLVDVLLAASVEQPLSLNLVKNSDRKVPISKRTMLIYGLCALLAVELIAGMAFKTGAPRVQRKQVARELAKIKRRVAPVQRMKEKNRELKRQLYRLNEICEQHVSVMEVLKQLSDALPEDTYLRSVSYKNGEGIRIKGRSKEPERLPELVLEIPMVDLISTSDIDKEIDGYHEFSLSVTLRIPDEETDA